MSGSATASLTALNGVSAASELAQAPMPGKALPVLEGLAGLLPWGGLRRGSTVVVRGSTTLLLALLAAATAEGSWAAVVGLPDLGLVAASELGVVVHRLALVPAPGPELVPVTAALLDGLDLVAVAEQPRAADARRLSARARHRGSVLLPVGGWPGADLELEGDGRWHGLSDGHGLLRTRELIVRAHGRGSAARGHQVRLTLPGGRRLDLPTDRPRSLDVPATDRPRSLDVPATDRPELIVPADRLGRALSTGRADLTVARDRTEFPEPGPRSFGDRPEDRSAGSADRAGLILAADEPSLPGNAPEDRSADKPRLRQVVT